MNYKTFKKQIEKMEVGEIVYINAINLSINSINELKNYIKKGILTPNIEELKKIVKNEYINNFLSGKAICPQINYIKL